MKHFSIFKMMVTLLLCTSAVSSEARLPNALTRFQVGYSYPRAKADYRLTLDDTSIFETVTTKGGFGATIGTHIPISKFGDATMIALTIDGLYNLLVWDMEPVNDVYNTNTVGYSNQYEITGGSVQLSVPIGLDLKFGCEAALEKSKGACFSFGAGAMPTAALTAYQDNAGAIIRLQPYVKAEFGVMAGICMKIRAIYAMGKFDYINVKNDAGDIDTYGASLTSKSTLTLSLLLMPFSYSWPKVKY